jgi:hypothetical protein
MSISQSAPDYGEALAVGHETAEGSNPPALRDLPQCEPARASLAAANERVRVARQSSAAVATSRAGHHLPL